jgi:hypothetical protein
MRKLSSFVVASAALLGAALPATASAAVPTYAQWTDAEFAPTRMC